MVENSVVFCRVDLLGDIALQLPSLIRLANIALSKKMKVSVVCGSAFVDLVADRLPDGISVIGINRTRFAKRPGYRFRVIRGLARQGHGAVVQLVWSRDLLVSDSVVRAMKATAKLALTASYDNMSRFQGAVGNSFYSKHFRPPLGMKFHGSVNQWFAEKLIEELFRNNSGEAVAVSYSNEYAVQKRPVFYVFPGTSQRTSFKRWPEESFARVIDEVIERTGWDCVIAGSMDEANIIRKTASYVKASNIRLVEGAMSLTEMYSELSSSSLVIANDSGPAHVAASVGVDVVVICGGGHPGSFFPYPEGHGPGGAAVYAARNPMACYGCGWHCIHEDRNPESAFPCITSVGADQVIAMLREAVKNKVALVNEFDHPARSG